MDERHSTRQILRRVALLSWTCILSGCAAAPTLPDAAGRGDLSEVRRLIATGHKTSEREKRRGHTALHKAALGGHLIIVAYLLNEDADVNARDSHGLTPLHLAAWNGSDEVVRLLLDRKLPLSVDRLKVELSGKI